MASESYNPGTFVTELYRRLDDKKKPLDPAQKGVLEDLIAETFGFAKQPTESVESVVKDPLAGQFMDTDILQKVSNNSSFSMVLKSIYDYSGREIH